MKQEKTIVTNRSVAGVGVIERIPLGTNFNGRFNIECHDLTSTPEVFEANM